MGLTVAQIMRIVGASTGNKARVIRPEELKKKLSPGKYKKEEL